MKGPLRRILPARRSPDPDPPASPPDAQVTIVEPPPSPSIEPPPAGTLPADEGDLRPTFRDRGRLRRRLRYLRRVRELGFRDLGGLVFDLHRFGRRNDALVVGKLAALDAVDRELRAIERVLDERRDLIELREPGVAACPRCGALHGSDARFCPQCGTQLTGPLALGTAVGGPATAGAGAGQTVAPPTVAAPAPGATGGSAAPPPAVPLGPLDRSSSPDDDQPTVGMPAIDEPASPPAPRTDGEEDGGRPVAPGDPLAHGRHTQP